jgi:hypothetical protein
MTHSRRSYLQRTGAYTEILAGGIGKQEAADR